MDAHVAQCASVGELIAFSRAFKRGRRYLIFNFIPGASSAIFDHLALVLIIRSYLL
jgi:hypothetical protein